MRLVATCAETVKQALTILDQVPPNSVVLFPENISLIGYTIMKYSKQKNLFIIINLDITVDNKNYIAMKAFDQGKYLWTVKKFNIWPSELEDGWTPAEPNPYVTIRGLRAGIYICYDCAKIYKMAPELRERGIELILVAANWIFNYRFLEDLFNFCIRYLPSIKAIIFSNNCKMAIIQTPLIKKKITSPGYLEVEI